ncbi:hypothetical protein WR25_23744 [Diploscapter pachys]|uniref:Uncharacterized protein n=1 Tax=Diploscapter pachys TaxID=2018661 RepID=A0A2A2JF60_9BILA|nr:hypothetical protein WR25_23744 [Diploscapter pachys]
MNSALYTLSYYPWDQEHAKEEIAKLWKTPADVLFDNRTVVIDVCRFCRLHWGMLFGATTATMACSTLFALSVRNLLKNKTTVSKSTFRTQKLFLVVLCCQVLIPLFLIVAPANSSMGGLSAKPAVENAIPGPSSRRA